MSSQSLNQSNRSTTEPTVLACDAQRAQELADVLHRYGLWLCQPGKCLHVAMRLVIEGGFTAEDLELYCEIVREQADKVARAPRYIAAGLNDLEALRKAVDNIRRFAELKPDLVPGEADRRKWQPDHEDPVRPALICYALVVREGKTHEEAAVAAGVPVNAVPELVERGQTVRETRDD